MSEPTGKKERGSSGEIQHHPTQRHGTHATQTTHGQQVNIVEF